MNSKVSFENKQEATQADSPFSFVVTPKECN